MEVIRSILRPGLPVRKFNETVVDYFRREGLWERRGWVGGYEMGIAFPPDWVGNFVFDPASDTNTDRVFEPRTAVNYENQFFMPEHQGQYFSIESFLFEEDGCSMLSHARKTWRSRVGAIAFLDAGRVPLSGSRHNRRHRHRDDSSRDDHQLHDFPPILLRRVPIN